VTGPGADAGVARVLVVDDNPMNRDLLARRVARLGHTVVLAEHGRAAVDSPPSRSTSSCSTSRCPS
jgi:DNA-binding NtrC family response regulator